MATASVNGQQLAYEDHGCRGLPVILSHGYLMDRSMFDAQVRALAGRRVITYDERGFGETRDDGGPFSYWDTARDVLALMDHLQIERAVLGGMSQGGFLSLRAALLAPERVAGLILLDTQAGREDVANLIPYWTMALGWVEHGPTDEILNTIGHLIIGDPVLAAPWIAKWRARPKASLLEPTRCLLERDDIHRRLAEIDAPALVVHGTADASIAMDKAERLAAGLSGAGGVTKIEGGSHAANMTHAEPVNAAIVAFLEAIA